MQENKTTLKTVRILQNTFVRPFRDLAEIRAAEGKERAGAAEYQAALAVQGVVGTIVIGAVGEVARNLIAYGQSDSKPSSSRTILNALPQDSLLKNGGVDLLVGGETVAAGIGAAVLLEFVGKKIARGVRSVVTGSRTPERGR